MTKTLSKPPLVVASEAQMNPVIASEVQMNPVIASSAVIASEAWQSLCSVFADFRQARLLRASR